MSPYSKEPQFPNAEIPYDWGDAPMDFHKQDPFGFFLYVGPRGAGKSLLMVHHARMFAEGRIRDLADGTCICDDPDCNAKWKVITTLNSPTLPEFGKWADRADLVNQVLDTKSDIQHLILMIDEIHQFADSRRAMSRDVMDIANQTTMLRKKKVHILASDISIDWVETRMRAMVTRAYNCWTPNRGTKVLATIKDFGLGHIPPWARHRVAPKWGSWDTEATKKYYDTYERVAAEAELKSGRTEKTIFIKNEFGERQQTTIDDLIGRVLLYIVDELEENETTTEEIIALVDTQYGVDVGRGLVDRFCQETGLIRKGDTYTLMAKDRSAEDRENALVN